MLICTQVRRNATALAGTFQDLGWKVVGGGTESHIVLLNVRESFTVPEGHKPVSGRDLAELCTMVGLITNRNGIPGDKGTPMRPDGLRLGTVSLTGRGAKEEDMKKIALWIDQMARTFMSAKSQFPSPFDAE